MRADKVAVIVAGPVDESLSALDPWLRMAPRTECVVYTGWSERSHAAVFGATTTTVGGDGPAPAVPTAELHHFASLAHRLKETMRAAHQRSRCAVAVALGRGCGPGRRLTVSVRCPGGVAPAARADAKRVLKLRAEVHHLPAALFAPLCPDLVLLPSLAASFPELWTTPSSGNPGPGAVLHVCLGTDTHARSRTHPAPCHAWNRARPQPDRFGTGQRPASGADAEVTSHTVCDPITLHVSRASSCVDGPSSSCDGIQRPPWTVAYAQTLANLLLSLAAEPEFFALGTERLGQGCFRGGRLMRAADPAHRRGTARQARPRRR